MSIRQKNWGIIENKSFDIAIIGGGISGASIYKELTQQGYKVFLVDKGDFSCGTSQASAMMIWGGLLYLKNLDLASVYHFSKDRDEMIKSFKDNIRQQYFRYIANNKWGRNKYLCYLALQLYWVLSCFKRDRPKFEKEFSELDFLNAGNSNESILYQEGFLKHSDSRLVLDWICNHQTEDSLAINYCSIQGASYNKKDKLWSLNLKDTFSNNQCAIKAKIIVNCAGVWTDRVNDQFGIQSPYKHVYSKGVFIGYERPKKHKLPLIFEMGEHGDTLTFIPWGPISLWGPTETKVTSIEDGYKVTPEDVRFLIKHASKNLDPTLAKSRIVSFRCGIRPLAVEKTFDADCYPLDISRNHKIVEDLDLPWISIYGGKISGCISMAKQVAQKIAKKISPSFKEFPNINIKGNEMSWASYPGLQDKVPSIDFCVNNEFCCTLEDYLRRRTNISQWVAREGLGFQNENLEYINNLTNYLPKYSVNNHLNEYKNKVNDEFDKVINQII